MNIVIYQFPAACSRVTMNALEETGLAYHDVCVNIRAGAQKSPDYLAINPKGKVPAVLFDGELMTETAAILWTLHALCPEAGLLPATPDPVSAHQALSDLVWCSATLHPAVRQVRMPMKWTTGATEGVVEDGVNKLLVECANIADRVGEGWWFGETWSIVDTYLYWAYSTAQKSGFPLERFSRLLGHAERVRARPAFNRVLAREQSAVERFNLSDVVL